ncbi:hypothetical protein [Hymenobacter chitinivorans]|uniref:Secreted protein (Por secretion system target) n=1 Tax=Hymenobacter chitinivorans DSM 11115 TaxID=1121954 RepID=A0A2M9AR05_9BACT|nr:hypothetical protein [Hymenobacter chitinivorans]PJJ48118.1 hypothetical protein CLV45_4811 [Hymenobacter chitinivorans DSM 11115]
MKSHILSFVLFLALSAASFGQAYAQTTFTSKPGGGKWTDASTWTVTGTTTGQTVPTDPTIARGKETNEVIVINSAVVLNQDYAVTGPDGMLTINAGGSLVQDVAGRTLSFGSQSGPDKMRLVTNGVLNVSSLNFYKADADINAPLEAACSITLANQSSLIIDSSVNIDGNLILLQGNNSVESGNLDGAGQVFIDGCVMTQGNGRGLVKDLFGNNLQVCIKGQGSDCGTTGIQGLTCNEFALEEVAQNACAAPLPVQLVSFAARPQEGRVLLSWATASELRSAAFTVERSADGRQFEPVATVEAAGSSNTLRTYSSLDARPLPGLNYYRLRQTDTDGTWSLSRILTVNMQGNAAAPAALEVYGTAALLNVDLQTAGVCQAIRVLDNMGRVLRTEQMPAGLTGSINRQLTLDRSVPGGVYIVQALTSQGMVSKRVMLTN